MSDPIKTSAAEGFAPSPVRQIISALEKVGYNGGIYPEDLERELAEAMKWDDSEADAMVTVAQKQISRHINSLMNELSDQQRAMDQDVKNILSNVASQRPSGVPDSTLKDANPEGSLD